MANTDWDPNGYCILTCLPFVGGKSHNEAGLFLQIISPEERRRQRICFSMYCEVFEQGQYTSLGGRVSLLSGQFESCLVCVCSVTLPCVHGSFQFRFRVTDFGLTCTCAFVFTLLLSMDWICWFMSCQTRAAN